MAYGRVPRVLVAFWYRLVWVGSGRVLVGFGRVWVRSGKVCVGFG